MSLFWRIAAPIALLIHIGVGAYLIAAGRTSTGLCLLALAVPLQWMGETPAGQRPQVRGTPHDQDVEPPLSVLAALGLAALCFVLAMAAPR